MRAVVITILVGCAPVAGGGGGGCHDVEGGSLCCVAECPLGTVEGAQPNGVVCRVGGEVVRWVYLDRNDELMSIEQDGWTYHCDGERYAPRAYGDGWDTLCFDPETGEGGECCDLGYGPMVCP